MYCEKCGAPLQGNEAFCAACGARVEAAPEAEAAAAAPIPEPEKVVDQTAAEPKPVRGGKAFSIIGKILGIVGLVLACILGLLGIVYPILALAALQATAGASAAFAAVGFALLLYELIFCLPCCIVSTCFAKKFPAGDTRGNFRSVAKAGLIVTIVTSALTFFLSIAAMVAVAAL